MHLLMTAPCLLGLEGLVADELRFMEAENVSAENGRVFFEGDEAMLARANINSRFAERILIVLDRFKAETFEELFQAVKALPWSEFIGSSDTFPVKGYSINSTLHSVPDCQKIVKKAVVESLKEDYGISWFEETGPVHQIQFSIMKNEVTIMIQQAGGFIKGAIALKLMMHRLGKLLRQLFAHFQGSGIITLCMTLAAAAVQSLLKGQ